jgi:SOS-response transcriptional repressor LexA
VLTTARGRYSLLTFEPPGQDRLNAGVLLVDPASDRLYVRLRRDWDDLVPEEAETLAAFESHLNEMGREMGASRALDVVGHASASFLATELRETIVEDFPRALDRLYRQHVPATVQPWKTHVPVYSLAAAAGAFRDNNAVEEEGWEEVPEGVRPSESMFAAHIVGHSMEPHIPDGSVCLFRAGVTGTRQNKLVLVEARGEGANDRYTVKRYKSEKRQNPDGTWQQERIRLESLNPDYPSWDLDATEDRYRIVAEFLRVLA